MKQLVDCCILLVEDEVLIGLDVRAILSEEGCAVIGPVGTVAEALDNFATHKIDAAVLDVNLGRERVFPVIDALRAAKVPFVILTGYSRDPLPKAYATKFLLNKPYLKFELVGMLEAALAAGLADAAQV